VFVPYKQQQQKNNLVPRAFALKVGGAPSHLHGKALGTRLTKKKTPEDKTNNRNCELKM